ncbi:MAG TPA: NAD(P)/FAD-dependent oxidoreductase [Steroidobacteraceae bacterium]|nr:NAD(P)/FAD-dependent oxidoreductase [Steroidobacteraceae bacterium]
MRFDAIVVGAGHNGLTSAAYLARAGLRVLVLERRAIIGGCAVTEEVDPVNAPGCRVSTASYIASMLRPEVIRDLKLGSYGLKMVACDPSVQVAFEDATVAAWWSDPARMRGELQRFAPEDIEAFFAAERELRHLSHFLEPFFMEAPPDAQASGWRKAWQGLRLMRRMSRLSGADLAELTQLLTGSLAQYLDRRFSSGKLKRLILANSVYGKHGGPCQPGTSMGLIFHMLTGGEARQPGFQGHVIGGMGAITAAMGRACQDLGVEIRTQAPVRQINQHRGRVRGVTLQSGESLDAPIVLSNADPKRTFLGLLGPTDLDHEFRRRVASIHMAGPCAKINYVLAEEPRVTGMPGDRSAPERSFFTLVPTIQGAENGYHAAQRGEISEALWVDCVLASNVDATLAPAGRHMLTCFVQYLPWQPTAGSWLQLREPLGDQVTRLIGRYAPNMPPSVVARCVLTPLDLEERFGISEGNIFHGDLSLAQMFHMRPLPECSQYRTPIRGLYLCGAGTHPGGGVTGAPGHNAAHMVLKDRSRRMT